MNALYRLEDAILGPVGRCLDGAVMPILARLVFLATLATFFWSSAMTKLGDGIGGIFSPSAGAYVQILPAQMEAVGYDESQLGLFADLIVLAGTWAEFIIPALIVLGLFTRAASLAMIGFILVMSFVDIVGHGGGYHDDRHVVRQCAGCENPGPAALLDIPAADPHRARCRPGLPRRGVEARQRIRFQRGERPAGRRPGLTVRVGSGYPRSDGVALAGRIADREDIMAKGYWVSCYRAVRNPDALGEYAKLAGPAIEAGGGRFLARGGRVQAYEAGHRGTHRGHRVPEFRAGRGDP